MTGNKPNPILWVYMGGCMYVCVYVYTYTWYIYTLFEFHAIIKIRFNGCFYIRHLYFRDHPSFDSPSTLKPRRKLPFVNHPSSSAHGSKPIRQHHRRDEEKVLYHKRAGIKLEWYLLQIQRPAIHTMLQWYIEISMNQCHDGQFNVIHIAWHPHLKNSLVITV